MPDTVESLKLSIEGAMKLLGAAITKAIRNRRTGMHFDRRQRRSFAGLRPHGRRVRAVDRFLADEGDDGRLLCQPTGNIAAGVDIKLAIATQGKRINLRGGLPIVINDHVVGEIGVGSGTGEQDRVVAAAALATLPDAKRFG